MTMIMTLNEALAVYLYLQHSEIELRDADPGWRDACDLIHDTANTILARYEDRQNPEE